MQVTSTFWAATQPLPRAERATIPHMKKEIEGFHRKPIYEIFFGEKALFSALSQSKGAAPRTAVCAGAGENTTEFGGLLFVCEILR